MDAAADGRQRHFYSVTFAPDDQARGWAVGTYGRILHTADGGLTWQPQFSDERSHLYSISFADKKTGAIAGG